MLEKKPSRNIKVVKVSQDNNEGKIDENLIIQNLEQEFKFEESH